MGHLHINIAHAAALNPRASRLRVRRDRKLSAILPSRANQMWYRAELHAIVKHLRAAGTALADAIRAPMSHLWRGDSAATDAHALPSEVEVAINLAAGKFGGIELVAARLAKVAARKNLQAVDDRLAKAIRKSVSVDVSGVFNDHGPIASALEKAARENAALITSIPQQYLDEVKNAVSEAWAEGARWETLVERIGQIGDVTDNRARLIARDQTQKMNAAFNEVRQTSLGIKRYTWHGTLDQRERPSHIRMEGSVQQWDAPPDVDGENVHPGQALSCRCSAIPVFDLDVLEAEAAA